MFNDKIQAQTDYLISIRKRIDSSKNYRTVHYIVLLSVFGLIGYLGTKNYYLSFVIGFVPTMIRAIGDQIILEHLRSEYFRTVCEFEGDLDLLEAKLKIESNISKVLK